MLLEQQIAGKYTANYRGKQYVFLDREPVEVPDDLAEQLLSETVIVFGRTRQQQKEISRFRESKASQSSASAKLKSSAKNDATSTEAK